MQWDNRPNGLGNGMVPRLELTYGNTTSEQVLQGRMTFGRKSSAATPDIFTVSPVVSRRHGEFYVNGGMVQYQDMGSMNGTFYNGRMLGRGEIVSLREGDVLRVHGTEDIRNTHDLIMVYHLNGQSNRRVATPNRNAKYLEIRIAEKNVFQNFKKFTLLRDINLNIPTGSMVLILGGSGAGKTTLMNAIMGYEKADGVIRYDGVDIYREYEKMQHEIGYVPQQDLLRMNDSVYKTLMNSAHMRLPTYFTDAQYQQRTHETMQMLGLEREKDSLVGKLSGGQRKRLSIAVEYVGNPSLFFLDEPDSGLDGIMARELMENLRDIADDNKIVMVISHAPDRAFQLFDMVIVLAKDSRDNCGHLAFAGPPREAVQFFGTDKLEGIVQKINRADEGGEGKAEYFIEKFEQMCR